MAKVRITYDKKQRTSTIDVEGVQGESCLDITKGLEQALGGVQSRAEKPEMHEQQSGDEHLNLYDG